MSTQTPQDGRARMERILALTHGARLSAEESDWNTVRKRTNERDALLRSFFAEGGALEDARWLRESLEGIVSSDEKLRVLARRRRDDVAEQSREMRRMSSAARIYKACGAARPDNIVRFAGGRKEHAASKPAIAAYAGTQADSE